MHACGNDHRYAFITGIIRACEAKMLNAERIDQLVQADSPNHIVGILRDTVYREFIGDNAVTNTLSRLPQLRREWLFRLIEDYAFHEELGDLLKVGYDYHNIKILLKERIFEQDNADALVDTGTIGREMLMDIFHNENYASLPPSMRKGVTEAIDAYYTTRRAIIIDLVLDGTLLKDLLERAKRIQCPLIMAHFRLAIDLSNLQTALRARGMEHEAVIKENLFIQGGEIDRPTLEVLMDKGVKEVAAVAAEQGLDRIVRASAEYPTNPFAIERESDNTLLDRLRPARFLLWGMEPVFAFGFAVEMELKILGIIISCRQAGLSPEWIRMRLPEPF